VFRLEFGNKVLEIPGESKNAEQWLDYMTEWRSTSAAVFEFETQNENEARIRMAHSGHYCVWMHQDHPGCGICFKRESILEIIDTGEITLSRVPDKRVSPAESN
jgi:hypothetical protein